MRTNIRSYANRLLSLPEPSVPGKYFLLDYTQHDQDEADRGELDEHAERAPAFAVAL